MCVRAAVREKWGARKITPVQKDACSGGPYPPEDKREKKWPLLESGALFGGQHGHVAALVGAREDLREPGGHALGAQLLARRQQIHVTQRRQLGGGEGEER